MHRHHLNPLLKAFCPNIYAAFRARDIDIIANAQHVKYHSRLSHSTEYARLLAEANEIYDSWSYGEEGLADYLDLLWDEFARRTPKFSHPCQHEK